MVTNAHVVAGEDETGELVGRVEQLVVARLGGSVSAEQGIGLLQVELLRRVKDPVALAMMASDRGLRDVMFSAGRGRTPCIRTQSVPSATTMAARPCLVKPAIGAMTSAAPSCMSF